MENNPPQGKRFDSYEPEKYSCISVNDDYIAPLLEEISGIEFYWHTVDFKAKGLAYYGITLIPPESTEQLISVLDKNPQLANLKELLTKAKQENKFIIHFGI